MKGRYIYKFLLAGMLACCIWGLPLFAQEAPAPGAATNAIKITGRVISVINNAPMQGVNVHVDGVAGSFQDTDENGLFSIYVSSHHVTLVFSYPGFREFSMFPGERTDLLIKMIPENYASSLDEVVLLPGDVRQKRFTTQAYQAMTEEQFTDRPYATMEGYLYGKIAGANVTAVNGMPGSATSINIRGISSVFAGSQPLYIVDGMEVSDIDYIKNTHNRTYNDNLFNSRLTPLNIRDIQSVTVLKDAAAKAAYGSRGGNGVIVIETAKGEKGNSRIDLMINQGFDLKGKEIPLMNAAENRQYLMEMAYSQYRNPADVMHKYGDVLFNDPTSPLYQKYNNETNWQNTIQKNTGYYGDYHFRIRGGDDVAKYSFSVGLFDKKGILEDTDMDKLSARFNLDYDVTEWLRIGTNLYFARLRQDRASMSFSQYNPLLLSLRKSPMTTPFVQNSSGTNTPTFESYDAFSTSNPLALSRLSKNEYTSNMVGGKMFGEFLINKEFSVALSLGLNNQTSQDKLFLPARGIVPLRDMYRISEQTYIEDLLFDGRMEVRYQAKLNNIHALSATLGANYLSDQLNYRLGRAYNSSSDEFTSLGQGTRDIMASYAEEWRMLAGYLQANYMYQERYIVDIALRADGSSRFGLDNRAIFYPAAGIAWRISQERFMDTTPWVDELKLRASVGYSGNDNLGNYTSRLLYFPANYKNLGGVSLGQLANEKLKPERILEYDLGLDIGIFNQRLNLSLDFYDRTTTNLLLPTNIPLEGGYPVALMNSGKLNNRGVEASLNVYFRTGDFHWNVGGNIACNKNKITRMPASTPSVLAQYDIFTAMATQGQAIGTYYGYQTNGVYASDQDAVSLSNGTGYKYDPFQGGDIRFVDQNNDQVIDDKDMVCLGKSMPDIIGGLTFQVSWKGITLNALLDMQLGREVINGTRYQLESMKDYSNQTIAVNQRWQQAGDITNMPRLAYDDPAGNSRFSDRWVEDGSFVRLRSLSLSYDIPDRYLQKIWLKKLRIFVNAENLLTYSKYLGFDPEFNHLYSDFISGVDAGSMYVPQSITFGIRIGL